MGKKRLRKYELYFTGYGWINNQFHWGSRYKFRRIIKAYSIKQAYYLSGIDQYADNDSKIGIVYEEQKPMRGYEVEYKEWFVEQ